MKQSRFTKGWDEKRVSELLAHYEPKSKMKSSPKTKQLYLIRADHHGDAIQARADGTGTENTKMLPERKRTKEAVVLIGSTV